MFESLREKIDNLSLHLSKENAEVFKKCFFNTIDTTCNFEEDGSVFVVTGDIPAMWLRDSAMQVMQYLFFVDDEEVQKLIKGVLKKQISFIGRDTYSNAFMNNPFQISEWDGKYLTDRWGKLTWERKFELDSLCYPLFLACKYYEKTQDDSIFTKEFIWVFDQIEKTVWIERKHSERSTYYCRFWNEDHTVGINENPLGEKGLVWTGYRPSDDECKYHYHIPDNMFLVSVLYKLAPIFRRVLKDEERAQICESFVEELRVLIEKYGIATNEYGKKIYVSETDCMGNWHADDDANIPSLLSLPYLEYPYLDKEIYKNTREFVLSSKNKFYYEGKLLKGIGSPHTPVNRVWPLAVAMQGITSDNEKEIKDCFEMLVNTTNDTGYMHESIDVNDDSVFSRTWFAWANSLFSYFVLKHMDKLSKTQFEEKNTIN